MTPDDPRHGTVAGAVAHKKLKEPMCDPCLLAHSRYEKRRVVRMATHGPAHIDALGTCRRIEALMSLGWALSELDARLGRKKTYTHAILKQKAKVSRATAREIDDLYEALSMTRPEGWVADRTRRIAAKNGYAPPLAFDNIDDPDEQPHGWGRNHPDRAADLHDLDQLHAGITEVCTRLRISRRSLEKWCARNNMTALYSRLVDREQPRYWRNGGAEGGVA